MSHHPTSPKYEETRVLTNLRSDLSDLKRDFADLKGENEVTSPLRPASSKATLHRNVPQQQPYRFGSGGGPTGTGYVQVLTIEDGNPEDEEAEAEDEEEAGGTGTLRESTNVIVLYRLQSLRLKSFANFLLAVLALLFMGLNVVMVVLNSMNNNEGDCEGGESSSRRSNKAQVAEPHSVFEARCGSPTSVWTFHMVEFTATFVFSVVQALALLCSPTPAMGRLARREAGATSVADSPAALKAVLVMAVVVNAVPTLLIWFNIEVFEVAAHEIEYANEITMSFIDLAFFMAIIRTQAKVSKMQRSGKILPPGALEGGMFPRNGSSGMVLALFALTVAIFQLYIYNGMGVTAEGERLGEKPAHYCEFTFEIISAIVTFFFCIDSKFACDQEIDAIMFADGEADAEVALLEKSRGSTRNRGRNPANRSHPSSSEKAKRKEAPTGKGKTGSKPR